MYSNNALDWLQIILHERFGHSFILEYAAQDKLTMTLPNDLRRVTFDVSPNTFNRCDSSLPFTQWDCKAEGWRYAISSPLPAPGSYDLPSPLISFTTNGAHVSYDVLGLAYWMLTRQEEVGRRDLDLHGRFSAFSSNAYKQGYLERPIVD
jgi:hypothetical protein